MTTSRPVPTTSSATGVPLEHRSGEQAFWDRVADAVDPEASDVPEGWASMLDALLDRLDPLPGRRFLDGGCGLGALSRRAASRGASPVGFDLSPRSLARAAGAGGPDEHYACSTFEELPFSDGAFGVAGGVFVLHHVDLPRAAQELHRVLGPGGRAAFLETWQRNPVIRAARRLRGRFGVARWGTEDEEPLHPTDLDVLRRAGFDVEVTYPALVFFRLVDNNVLKRRWAWATTLLGGTDDLLWRIRRLRPFGYYCLIRLTRTD